MRALTLARTSSRAALRRQRLRVPLGGSRSLFGFGGSDDDAAVGTPGDGVVEFLSTSDMGYWPSHMAVRVFENVHTLSGTEWWVTIAVTTVAVRVFLFPLTIKLMRGSAKMAMCKPEIDALTERAKERGTTPDQQQTLAVYRKHGVNPLATIALPFMQMPFFVSCFFGTRQLCEYYDITAGGTSFFLDLAASDPTHVLPIACAASFAATIELGGEPGVEQQANMKWIMRGLALTFVPIAWSMPCAVLVYWNVNNGLSLLQAAVLKIPGAKASLGIASPAASPVVGMGSMASRPKTYAKPPSQRDPGTLAEVTAEAAAAESDDVVISAEKSSAVAPGEPSGAPPAAEQKKKPKFKKKRRR